MTEDLSDKKFRWGTGSDEIAASPADVPTQSLFALAQRGWSHVFGNEVAAQVAAKKKTEEGAKMTEAELAEFASQCRKDKLEKILKGELGVRVAAGPRVTGIDAIMRSIAVERIKAKFKAYSEKTGSKVTLPTGDNTVNYMGKPMTRDDLVGAMLRAQETSIRSEAEKRQAALAEAASVGDDLSFGEE